MQHTWAKGVGVTPPAPSGEKNTPSKIGFSTNSPTAPPEKSLAPMYGMQHSNEFGDFVVVDFFQWIFHSFYIG
jgi:hypothetical protein